MFFVIKRFLNYLRDTGPAQKRKTAGQMILFCLLLAACGVINGPSGSPADLSEDWKQLRRVPHGRSPRQHWLKNRSVPTIGRICLSRFPHL